MTEYYKVPDEIKRFPRLCMDCIWSEYDPNGIWRNRCFNKEVVSKDYWALSMNHNGQPYGSDCGDERKKKFGVCGMKGKKWQLRKLI